MLRDSYEIDSIMICINLIEHIIDEWIILKTYFWHQSEYYLEYHEGPFKELKKMWLAGHWALKLYANRAETGFSNPIQFHKNWIWYDNYKK